MGGVRRSLKKLPASWLNSNLSPFTLVYTCLHHVSPYRQLLCHALPIRKYLTSSVCGRRSHPIAVAEITAAERPKSPRFAPRWPPECPPDSFWTHQETGHGSWWWSWSGTSRTTSWSLGVHFLTKLTQKPGIKMIHLTMSRCCNVL